MKPDSPILMLSLLIPVTADTSPEQVLNIIGQQVSEALQQIKVHQAVEAEEVRDPEAIPQEEFNDSLLQETTEAYTEQTKSDLLAKLGYPAQA